MMGRMPLCQVTVLCLLSFLCIPSGTFASGEALHLLMIKYAQANITDPELRKFVDEESNALKNGVIFPDAGYILGGFGEDSHWSGFHNAYLDIFVKECGFSIVQGSNVCRKIFAHFLGCIAHTMGDVRFDRYFLTEVAKADFQGDLSQAQKIADPGLDFIALVEQEELIEFSKFVPLEVLRNVFSSMSLSLEEITIKKATNLQYWAILRGESFVAPYVYDRYKAELPWAQDHYISHKGGVLDSAKFIANLWEVVWAHFYPKTGFEPKLPRFYNKGGWPEIDYGVLPSL